MTVFRLVQICAAEFCVSCEHQCMLFTELVYADATDASASLSCETVS